MMCRPAGRPVPASRLLKSRRWAVLAAAVAAGPLAGVSARAVDLTVDQASGNPTFTYASGSTTYDLVRVGVTSAGTATQNGGTLTANGSLLLGVNAGGNGLYTLNNAGVLTVNGTAAVGRAGTGVFTQNNGTTTFAGGLFLSAASGGNGTYNLNGGTLNAVFVNGNTGGGTNSTFNFNGGTLRARANSTTFLQGLSTLNVRNNGAAIDTNGFNVTVTQGLRHSTISGDDANDGGLDKLGGGTLTLSGMNTYTGVTNVLAGTLALTGGVIGQSGGPGDFRIDGPASAAPTFSISGTASLYADLLWAGYTDGGTLNQSGGTVNAQSLFVGRSDLLDASNSRGYYNQTSGSVSSGVTIVGDRGIGVYTQTAGTHSTSNLRVGDGAGAFGVGTGTYALGGTGQLTTSLTQISFAGSGAFNQTGGTHTAGGLRIGFDNRAGSYTLSGTTSQLNTNISNVAYTGPGTFTHSGGTHATGTLQIGRGGAAGTYGLSGGQLTVTGTSFVGYDGPGTFTQTAGTHSTGELQLGLAGRTGTYGLSGSGTLNVTGNEFIGLAGSGTFTQTGGTHSVGGLLYLGFPGVSSNALTGRGTFELSGGSLTTAETQIANLGNGTFTQTGGTHTTPRLFIGLNNGVGAYALGGTGQLTVNGNAIIGFAGPGTFTQTGGTATITNAFVLSGSATGVGTLNLNGGNLYAGTIAGNLNGGANAVLNFNDGILRPLANSTNFIQNVTVANVRNGGARIHTNGFNVTLNQPLLHSTISGDAAIDGGLAKGGNGTLTLTAANSYTGDTTVIAGTLAITAGSIGVINSSARLLVDGTAADNATASLSGAATLGEYSAIIGQNGRGTFNQTGGTHLVTATLYLGFPVPNPNAVNSNGTYALSGGTLQTNETQVGNGGTGTFNQTGGTHTAGQLTLGLNGTGGTYTLSGTGQLTTTGAVAVGYSGPATFTQTGGTATVNASLYVSAIAGGSGVYNLDGGTLVTSRLIGNSNGGTNATFNFNGGTFRPTGSSATAMQGFTAANVRNGGARIDVNGVIVNLDQVLRHSQINGDAAVDGGLTKLGNGSLTLTAANTYTGATVVSAGTLTVKYSATAASAATPLLSGAGGANVQNGRLVFDYVGSTSPITKVRSLLAASFAAATTPGVIDSGQLRSSTATLARGLGYLDNGFGQLTLLPTMFGDADLDGGVSINDFNALAANFGQANKVWSQGDFDYDGGVSINDFNLLAAGFGQSMPINSPAWAGLLAFAATHNDLVAFEAVTGVPEPTALGLLAGGVTLGLRRRRA